MDVQLPSITKLCPVIWRAWLDTKNKAAWAISAGEAGRLMGVIFDQVL